MSLHFPPLSTIPLLPGVSVLQGMKGQGRFLEGRSLRFNGTFSARSGDCKTQLFRELGDHKVILPVD